MQISFQLASAPLRFVVFLACASLSLLLPSTLQGEPYASTWAGGPKSSLRLIAAEEGLAQGVYRSGVELRLEPGALTYWRTPGSAGVPPVFSFDGSTNAAEVAVSYPAPARMVEDGAEVFGYRDHVVFPVRVTPEDPSRPVRLVLNLSYAVCARICLPANGLAELTLQPSPETSARQANPQAGTIAAAEALVPVHLTRQQAAAKVAITRVEGAPAPSWRLVLRDGDAEDVFAEGPPGWYFDSQKTGKPNEFLIVEIEKPSTGETAQPPVTLTVKSKRQSFEFAVALDAAPDSAKNDPATPETPLRTGQN